MKTNLLVGSANFWKSLEADISTATQTVLVQTLSFEGDGPFNGHPIVSGSGSSDHCRLFYKPLYIRSFRSLTGQ